MTIQYQGVWSLQNAAQLQSTQRWVTDPLFENTTLLLQADDAANGAQNNTFLDSSSNSFAITRNPASGPNAPTQGSFSPFSAQPGAWSSYYSGVADTNGTYFAANAAYSFGTGDFTVEAWINIPPISNTNGKMIVDSRPNATNGSYWLFALNNAGRLEGVTMTSGGVSIVSPNPVPTNQWVHVAYTRASGTLNLWVNGVSVASATGNTNNISSDTLWVGRNAFSGVASDTWFSGYMSNLRIVKGVAVYTGTFTPPASPLEKTQSAGINIAAITGSQTSLLFNQSNRFIDNSNINATPLTLNTWPTIQPFSPFAPQFQWTPSVIGGSAYFDNAVDSLTISTAINSQIGALAGKQRTYEFWVNTSGIQAVTAFVSGLFGNFTSGAVNGRYAFSLVGTSATSSQTVRFSYTTSTSTSANVTTTNGLNQQSWNHIAITIDATTSASSTIVIYLNGVGQTFTGVNLSTHTTDPNLNFVLGDDRTGNQLFWGYVGGVKISSGIQRSSNFTPPTSPFTSDANTFLLLNFTNAGIVDGTMKNNLETVGNAQISTAVVKYGSGSMYFDGTGDYLRTLNSQNISFGTGDFTIEMWLWFNATPTGDVVVMEARPSNTAVPWIITADATSGGTLYFYDGTTYRSTIPITPQTWMHFAVSRVNGTLRIFNNGVQGFSGTVTTSLNPTGALIIGARNDGLVPFTGYMDDIRITKGIGRYTQNFIPPSVALPRQ